MKEISIKRLFSKFIKKEVQMTDIVENPLSEESIKKLVKEVQYIIPSIAPMTTIAVVVTHSGFTVMGESNCFNSDCYNKEMGEQFALEDAIKKLTAFHAYFLKESKK